jgi:hypothetical protein
MLVLNKPASLLSVPGKSVMDSVYFRMRQRYPEATGPLIVHRLDMGTSGLMLVAKTAGVHKELQSQFYELNIEYAEQSIIREFERAGFRIRRDWDFKANEEVSKQFFMVAETRMQGEEERETVIKFSILSDGTIVTDSNYIPHDVHELADKAMLELDKSFGTTRREGFEIKRKTIPEKYRGKTYCSASGQITSNQEITTLNKIIIKN